MRNIFITGATGFLGSNLLKIILSEKDTQVYILVRARDTKAASKIKGALINSIFSKSARNEISHRLHAVRGDISEDNLGLNKRDFRKLQGIVDTVYHCAAIRDFAYDLDTIRIVNVKGTENLLKTALTWKNKGRLENVNYISTAYVAGNYTDTFYETQLDVSQRFNNTYEQSKFEAERVVVMYRKKGLPVDIYRPSVITDAIAINKSNLSMAFRFLTIFTLQLFKSIPAEKKARFNLVPVDAVSKAIYLISTTKDRFLNQNYHIVNPRPLRVDTLLDVLSSVVGFKKPRLISAARFRLEDLTPVQRRLIEDFVPYLNQRLSFDMRNASSLLKKYKFKIPRITRELLVKAFKAYQVLGLLPGNGQLCY